MSADREVTAGANAFGGHLVPGSHPAVLSIDLMRAYTDPSSPFYIGSMGPVRSAARVIAAARDCGVPVLHTRVEYAPDGADGGHFVRKVGAHVMPVTVFVTAYDQHALSAFELAAIDYLVKPFDDERFEQSFQRARRQVELQEVERVSGQLFSLLQSSREGTSGTESALDPAGSSPAVAAGSAAAQLEPAKAPYLERIAVDMRGQVRVVPVKHVEYITASGPYAELHVGDKRYVLRERMQTLEERINVHTHKEIEERGIRI